jgi:hypothetical protein
MLLVQSRLSKCQHALTKWSRRKLKDGEGQLKKKSKLLVELQEDANLDTVESIKALLAEIDETLAREDVKWN